MRILLVEDNRVLGEALRDHLEAMGHDTEWRKGLIESVSATRAYTFDVNGGVKTGHGAEQKSATVAPA